MNLENSLFAFNSRYFNGNQIGQTVNMFFFSFHEGIMLRRGIELIFKMDVNWLTITRFPLKLL